MFRSSNPTLRESFFAQDRVFSGQPAMTIQGTINKCFILLFLIVLSASWVWGQVMPKVPMIAGVEMQQAGNPAAMGIAFWGWLLGMVFGFITIFKRDWAPVTAPIYALCEGAFLGGVSAIFEMQYPGMVIQAIALTFGVLFCMLAIYRSGLIKVDQKFIMGVSAAVSAIFLIYVVNIVLGLFGRAVPIVNSSGPFGIGFSVIVCGVAALCLMIDFYRIEEYSRMGLNKRTEWYAAFGLMVTLVWLYLEILRLLAKMNRR